MRFIKFFRAFQKFVIPKAILMLIAKFRGLVQDELDPVPVFYKLFDELFPDKRFAFNPALMRNDKGFLVFFRTVSNDLKRSVYCLQSSENFGNLTLKNEVSIGKYQSGEAIEWCADPRVFTFDGKFYITFNTGHSEKPNQIYIQEISSSGEVLSDPYTLVKLDGRRDIEKNWGFFEWNKELYAVYSISPFVVLKIVLNPNDKVAYATENSVHYWDSKSTEHKYGELRGGASPLCIGDRYYYVVQSNKRSAGGSIYTGSIFVFENAEGFRPLEYSTSPLFVLDKMEYKLSPPVSLNKRVEACLYSSGSYYDKAAEIFYIAYGINDYRFAVRAYRRDQIDGRLALISQNVN